MVARRKVKYYDDGDDADIVPSLAQQQEEEEFEKDIASNPPGPFVPAQHKGGVDWLAKPNTVMVAPPKERGPADYSGGEAEFYTPAPHPDETQQVDPELNIPVSAGGGDNVPPAVAEALQQRQAQGQGGNSFEQFIDKVRQAPTMSKPSWLQNLASRAVGAAAGWSNAASRTRNPIDINAVKEGVLHPNYADQMQVFNSQLAPIQRGYELEAAARSAQAKNAQLNARAGLEQAQGEQALAHGAYWLHRAQQDPKRYVPLGKGGDVLDTFTNEVKKGAPTAKDLYDEAMSIPGTTPQQATEYALNKGQLRPPSDKMPIIPQGAAIPDGKGGFIVPNPKPLKQVDPAAAQYRQDRQQDMRDNENTRINDKFEATKQRLLQEQERTLNQLRASGVGQTDVEKQAGMIRQHYANQLQSAQDAYENEVRNHHGTPQHYIIKPGDGKMGDDPQYTHTLATPAPIQSGPTAPPQQTAKPPAQPPQVTKQSAPTPQAPPISALAGLRPGLARRFSDGSRWTIGPNGQPVQVNAK